MHRRCTYSVCYLDSLSTNLKLFPKIYFRKKFKGGTRKGEGERKRVIGKSCSAGEEASMLGALGWGGWVHPLRNYRRFVVAEE